MSDLINTIYDNEFVILDYGNYIELHNHSVGYLVFSDWDQLLRLANFIERHCGHIRQHAIQKLIIFDKDGTLMTKKGGGDPPIPNHVDEQVPLPGVIEKCDELREAGHTLAIASNQGGVAFGFLTEREAGELMEHARTMIGAESYLYCVHHPEGIIAKYAIECNCRKPAPGMITLLMQHLGFDANNTIFVGDMDSDRQAAEAAGIRFVWAEKFFEVEKSDD